MIGIRNFKSVFFDRVAVTDAVDKATRRVLSKFGAFVRTAAKHSIKKRKGVSKPGQPPSSHTGLLRRFIFFGFDPVPKSVVIGPAKLNTGTDAPHTLEYSGIAKVNKRRIIIAERPFMHPAFESEKSKLPQMWKDSIR